MAQAILPFGGCGTTLQKVFNSEASMRYRRLAALAFLAAPYATLTIGCATAVERLHPNVPWGYGMKTLAYKGNGPKMSPYSAALHGAILAELQRTDLNFVLPARTTAFLRLDIDRRGKLIGVSVVQGLGLKIADDQLVAIVRQAARRFPPPASGVPQTPQRFLLPIRFQ